jgi:hypothetical protein
MGRLRLLIARFRRSKPVDWTERAHSHEARFDSTDALTAGRAGDTGGEAAQASGGMPPPSWVKSYDDGRPRK